MLNDHINIKYVSFRIKKGRASYFIEIVKVAFYSLFTERQRADINPETRTWRIKGIGDVVDLL